MEKINWKELSLFDKSSIIMAVMLNLVLIGLSFGVFLLGWVPFLILNIIFIFVDWDLNYFLSKMIKIDK